MLKADLLEPELKQWCAELISAQDVKDDWFRIRIGRLVCDAQANLATRLSGILAAEKNQDKIFALLTNEADHASEGLCNANLKEAEDNFTSINSMLSEDTYKGGAWHDGVNRQSAGWGMRFILIARPMAGLRAAAQPSRSRDCH